jgi:hypothetical protein
VAIARLESSTWIALLLEAHADEIVDRAIHIRLEFDPRLQLSMDEKLEVALIGLVRFAVSTVPDGCEIFMASARGLGPVERLESGSLTLRWQVAGEKRGRPHEKVTAMRPLVGNARTHVQSRIAADLKDAFDAAGWGFELLAMAEDRELWAKASKN